MLYPDSFGLNEPISFREPIRCAASTSHARTEPRYVPQIKTAGTAVRLYFLTFRIHIYVKLQMMFATKGQSKTISFLSLTRVRLHKSDPETPRMWDPIMVLDCTQFIENRLNVVVHTICALTNYHCCYSLCRLGPRFSPGACEWYHLSMHVEKKCSWVAFF